MHPTIATTRARLSEAALLGALLAAAVCLLPGGASSAPTVGTKWEVPAEVMEEFREGRESFARRHPPQPTYKRAVEKLLRQRDSNIGWLRDIVDLGFDALLPLVDLLRSDDRQLRATAASTLVQVARELRERGSLLDALPSLLKPALYDPEEDVRGAIFQLVSVDLGAAVGLNEAAEWLDGTFGSAQAAAVRGLVMHGRLDLVPDVYYSRWLEIAVYRGQEDHVGFSSPWRPHPPQALIEPVREVLKGTDDGREAVPGTADSVRAARALVLRFAADERWSPVIDTFCSSGIAGVKELERWLRYPNFGDLRYDGGWTYRFAALRLLRATIDRLFDVNQSKQYLTPLFLRSTYDSHPLCREEALTALRTIEDERAIPQFERCLSDYDPVVRYHAAKGLIEHGHARSIPNELLESVEAAGDHAPVCAPFP